MGLRPEPCQRDRALLIEDGVVVSNFNVPLEEIGPPPLPSLDELVPRANTLLADLEKEDAFGQLFAGVSTTWLLRTLLVAFTLGCGGGSSGAGVPPPNAATGNFTVTVHAKSGSVDKTTTIALTVN